MPMTNPFAGMFAAPQQGQQPGAGLLDDPRMAALMGAAGGLLSASGPTPYKVGLGGMMGQGLGGAMSGMIGAEQMSADREMQKMMMEFMRQQMGQGARMPQPGAPMPLSPGPRAQAPQMPRLPLPTAGMTRPVRGGLY